MIFLCFTKQIFRGALTGPRQSPQAIKEIQKMTNICAPLGAIAIVLTGRAVPPRSQRIPAAPLGEPNFQVDAPPTPPSDAA